ncbi:MAG TPA: FAD-dependent monooxygenase [Bryobacteraceae bacterium]|nr:FAD-dependent monooxygenase [Bryobacteraceae bacterium]
MKMLAGEDVCVVGGGPAGLAAAIALAQDGYKLTVVDYAIPPIDKTCGEGLMPDGLSALERLGVEIPPEVGFSFKGIRFSDRHSAVVADFPSGTARGVRRTILHDLLIKRAITSGVSFVWGAKHVRIREGGVAIDGGFLRARLVIGADGQNSQIRRQVGLDRIRRERRRYGFRRHYRIAPWSPYMELYWGPKCQMYVTPIAADEVCVALISRDSRLRLNEGLQSFPELRRRLESALSISTEMGALSVSRTLHRIYRAGLALVGDASGSVDAITGEGMCLSFKQAIALACCLQTGDLDDYQPRHTALMKRPRLMASLMLYLETNSQLQKRALTALARQPDIFKSLLAIHVGASSTPDLCAWRLLDFGLAFLVS